jgi:hypothetical protein
MDLSAAIWHMSGDSQGGGSDCVEVAAAPAADAWRKSSYSSGGGSDCVEVAPASGSLAIRDSKDPDGGFLVVAPDAFRGLVNRIKHSDVGNLTRCAGPHASGWRVPRGLSRSHHGMGHEQPATAS